MLLRRPHPQHRRGRRGAGEPVAGEHRGAPGRHPLPAVEALQARRAQPGAGRRDAHERAHARAELGRPQGADRGHGHRRAQGPRDDRALRHRHLPQRRRRPARLRGAAGEASHRAHPGRGVLLRRLHGRGLRGRQALPHRGEHGRRRRRDRLRLLRDRSAAHVLAEHSDRRRPPPRAADGPLHLRDVHHGPFRAAELRTAAARALRHSGGVAGQSEVPGRGRHAQPGRHAAAVVRVRRVRAGAARHHARGLRRRRPAHQRAHHRPAHRPAPDGEPRPHHRRQRRDGLPGRHRRIRRELRLPQEHPRRDQRGRGAGEDPEVRLSPRIPAAPDAGAAAPAPRSSSRCSPRTRWLPHATATAPTSRRGA